MIATQNPPRDGEGDRRAQPGGGGGSPPSLRRPEVYLARRQRKTMSLPEVLLWRELRAQAGGLRFRKQHPIKPYYADFYCAAARLVIEIDGKAHDMGDNPQRDLMRDAFLEARGYTVLRIPATDVLADAGAVAASVVQAADPLRQSPSLPRATPQASSKGDCHLPMNGEDL